MSTQEERTARQSQIAERLEEIRYSQLTNMLQGLEQDDSVKAEYEALFVEGATLQYEGDMEALESEGKLTGVTIPTDSIVPGVTELDLALVQRQIESLQKNGMGSAVEDALADISLKLIALVVDSKAASV